MKKNKWVIHVAGYGSFFFEGTEKKAEEMRQHKARWEQGIGLKRLADEQEIKTSQINPCLNHPNFKKKHRYHCDCDLCNSDGDMIGRIAHGDPDNI